MPNLSSTKEEKPTQNRHNGRNGQHWQKLLNRIFTSFNFNRFINQSRRNKLWLCCQWPCWESPFDSWADIWKDLVNRFLAYVQRWQHLEGSVQAVCLAGEHLSTKSLSKRCFKTFQTTIWQRNNFIDPVCPGVDRSEHTIHWTAANILQSDVVLPIHTC